MLRRTAPTPRAFTLIELIVGAILIALIAGATASALASLVRTRGSAMAHRQAFARASDAASRIALDAIASVRDQDLAACKVMVKDGGRGEAARDELLLLCRTTRPVRADATTGGEPEGADIEVQYRVVETAGVSPRLWRRADPALDGYVDGGGIASPIVDNIRSLNIYAYDGTKWFESWDSDAEGLPHALRIEVTAGSDERGVVASARRVVPLDRVPVMPKDDASDSSSGSGTDGTSSGTTGSTSGGTTTGGGGQ